MLTEQLIRAKEAKRELALIDTDGKNRALKAMADSLLLHADEILAANKIDIDSARGSVSDVMIDRLTLTPERIKAMAEGIYDVIELPDPVGRVITEYERRGMTIKKVSSPIGVVAIIYESRPNVTSDAAALVIKSGNVCILRGGKEAFNSNKAIVDALREGLRECGYNENFVSLVTDTTRESANRLMKADGYVDLLIPRGGAGLIKACVENSTVPCIQTGTGICHIYVDSKADINMALDIIDNAKTSRPSVCNAAEVCLVSREVAKDFLPLLKERLVDKRKADGKIPVELRLDTAAASVIDGTPAGENDFDTEFLDYILAVKVVDGVKAAVEHIAAHSTGHSEAIITADESAAEYFCAGVDSAAVYVNASTRFTDGGEFGLGCEIGISTQKLHARGPMGLCELTTYKYVVSGSGQVR